MVRDVPVHGPACAHVENEEHERDPKRHCDRRKEIARQNFGPVVAHECAARLPTRTRSRRGRPRHVAPDDSGRYRHPPLQPRFRRDAHLTPGAIGRRHFGDHAAGSEESAGDRGGEISSARTAATRGGASGRAFSWIGDSCESDARNSSFRRFGIASHDKASLQRRAQPLSTYHSHDRCAGLASA